MPCQPGVRVVADTGVFYRSLSIGIWRAQLRRKNKVDGHPVPVPAHDGGLELEALAPDRTVVL